MYNGKDGDECHKKDGVLVFLWCVVQPRFVKWNTKSSQTTIFLDFHFSLLVFILSFCFCSLFTQAIYFSWLPKTLGSGFFFLRTFCFSWILLMLHKLQILFQRLVFWWFIPKCIGIGTAFSHKSILLFLLFLMLKISLSHSSFIVIRFCWHF